MALLAELVLCFIVTSDLSKIWWGVGQVTNNHSGGLVLTIFDYVESSLLGNGRGLVIFSAVQLMRIFPVIMQDIVIVCTTIVKTITWNTR